MVVASPYARRRETPPTLESSGDWPLSIEQAVQRFAGASDPAMQALAWVQERSGKVERAQREAFVVFIAWRVWKDLGLSCEAAFDRLFGLNRRTLYRWKQELGQIDGARSVSIRHGKASSEYVRKSAILSRGNDSGQTQCATTAHCERPMVEIDESNSESVRTGDDVGQGGNGAVAGGTGERFLERSDRGPFAGGAAGEQLEIDWFAPIESRLRDVVEACRAARREGERAGGWSNDQAHAGRERIEALAAEAGAALTQPPA